MEKWFIKKADEKIVKLREELPKLFEKWNELKKNPTYEGFEDIWTLVEEKKDVIDRSKVSYKDLRGKIVESFVQMRLEKIYNSITGQKIIKFERKPVELRIDKTISYKFDPDFIFYTDIEDEKTRVFIRENKTSKIPVKLLIAIECKTHVSDKTHHSRPVLESLILNKVTPETTFILLSKTNVIHENNMKVLRAIGAGVKNYQINNRRWEDEVKKELKFYNLRTRHK